MRSGTWPDLRDLTELGHALKKKTHKNLFQILHMLNTHVQMTKMIKFLFRTTAHHS